MLVLFALEKLLLSLYCCHRLKLIMNCWIEFLMKFLFFFFLGFRWGACVTSAGEEERVKALERDQTDWSVSFGFLCVCSVRQL